MTNTTEPQTAVSSEKILAKTGPFLQRYRETKEDIESAEAAAFQSHERLEEARAGGKSDPNYRTKRYGSRFSLYGIDRHYWGQQAPSPILAETLEKLVEAGEGWVLLTLSQVKDLEAMKPEAFDKHLARLIADTEQRKKEAEAFEKRNERKAKLREAAQEADVLAAAAALANRYEASKSPPDIQTEPGEAHGLLVVAGLVALVASAVYVLAG